MVTGQVKTFPTTAMSVVMSALALTPTIVRISKLLKEHEQFT